LRILLCRWIVTLVEAIVGTVTGVVGLIISLVTLYMDVTKYARERRNARERSTAQSAQRENDSFAQEQRPIEQPIRRVPNPMIDSAQSSDGPQEKSRDSAMPSISRWADISAVMAGWLIARAVWFAIEGPKAMADGFWMRFYSYLYLVIEHIIVATVLVLVLIVNSVLAVQVARFNGSPAPIRARVYVLMAIATVVTTIIFVIAFREAV
jgi:hypothetical protein